MANFDEHILQAKRNLVTLQSINTIKNDSWDWQVTIAYYVAVHLINAHIAKVANAHYNAHEKVKNALFAQLSPCKVSDEIYTAYVKLEGLSRRARYLCHEDSRSQDNHLTYDRHLKKAVGKLDQIIEWFSKKYSIDLPIIHLDCIELKNSNFINFKYKNIAAA